MHPVDAWRLSPRTGLSVSAGRNHHGMTDVIALPRGAGAGANDAGGVGREVFLVQVWQRAVTLVQVGPQWRILRRTERPMLLITGMNPRARACCRGYNVLADRRLAAALKAARLPRLRARSVAPDGTWCEDGWLIPSQLTRDRKLLRRFGQLAGWRFGPMGRVLCWP